MDICVADLLKENGVVQRPLIRWRFAKVQVLRSGIGWAKSSILELRSKNGGLPSDNLNGPELPKNHYPWGRWSLGSRRCPCSAWGVHMKRARKKQSDDGCEISRMAPLSDLYSSEREGRITRSWWIIFRVVSWWKGRGMGVGVRRGLVDKWKEDSSNVVVLTKVDTRTTSCSRTLHRLFWQKVS